MDLLKSNSNSEHFYADVPIHQLLDMDITKMSPAELNAYIDSISRVQHSPAARRSVAKKESSKLQKGQVHETVDKALAHLL